MKKVQIQCKGYSVEADWYEGASDKVLLTLIGFSSKKSKYQKETEKLVDQLGMSVLVLDYSGHGNSPFELTEVTPAQNFSEVVIAFDWLLAQGYDETCINVMGISYGGFHGTHLTHYRNFNKLILRVPAIYDPESFYTQLKDVSDTHRHEYRRNADNFTDHWLFKNNSIFTGSTYVITHELDELCPTISTDAFIGGMVAEDTYQAVGFAHGLLKNNPSDKDLDKYFSVIADWLVN